MRFLQFLIIFLLSSTFLSAFAFQLNDKYQIAQYQQRPPLYAPRHMKYRNNSKEEAEENEKEDSVKQKITWQESQDAERWFVVVSKDEELSDVIFCDFTKVNSISLPHLKPGVYFYKAYGLNKKTVITETEIQNIEIASTPDGILPSPEIITPEEMEYFPPKPKMRIAWKSIKGAVAYRFRIWEYNKVQNAIDDYKIPVARWITEIKEPWIELYDVPYSTYQYMASGIYNYDVTAIDSNGNLGAASSSTFRVTPQYYLKPKQLSIRIYPVWAPAWKQMSYSATSGESYSHSTSSIGLGIDLHWWYKRHSGMLADILFDFKKLAPAGNFTNYQVGFDYAFRTYLSHVEEGTGFVGYLGLRFKQFSEIDLASKPTRTTAPTGVGPRIGARLFKEFALGFHIELCAEISSFFYTLNANGLDYTRKSGINSNSSVLNVKYEGLFLFPISKQKKLIFGVRKSENRVKYQPASRLAYSGVNTNELFYFAGLQFDY